MPGESHGWRIAMVVNKISAEASASTVKKLRLGIAPAVSAMCEGGENRNTCFGFYVERWTAYMYFF